MDIGVIGAGYVGLVQAVGLARSGGHRVRVAEIDATKLAALVAGHAPLFEEGLQEALEEALYLERLTFHSDNAEVVRASEVTFICLPTPPGIDGAADLSIVSSALAELATAVDGNPLVAIKSTVPVGTTRRLSKRFAGVLRIVHNPEFLREGSALEDLESPNRVVVGGDDAQAVDAVAAVYGYLDAPVVVTDPTSAELIKYASNAYLATRITFVNALANIAESMGADILDVTRGMGLDNRIGPHFLAPGPGYGGSCFPKDTVALLATSRQAGYEFSLLHSVVDVDQSQRHWVVGNIRRMLGGDLEGARVAMWGIAFKAGTDDTRESPAVKIARVLMAEGAVVTAYDPRASDPEIKQVDDPVEAARGAALLVVATEWPEFRQVDMSAVAAAMDHPVIYDVRNLLDPATVRAAGLTYVALGRPNV